MQKVAPAKSYNRKNTLVAADLLNDRMSRIISGSCVYSIGALQSLCKEHHEFQIHQAIDDIDTPKLRQQAVIPTADCKMLAMNYDKVVPLPVSGEAETGSGVDQPGRNSRPKGTRGL